MSSLQMALRTQSRVVWALMLRETKTLFGKHKLGYLWAFIQAAFSVAIFWVMREFLGFSPPDGLSTPAFLIAGFVPFYMFSNAVTGGMHAISGNRALLAYPQVFPLDIILARVLLNGALHTCVMASLLLAAFWLGHSVTFYQPELMLLSLCLALALGFGVGTLCSALNLMLPATARIEPMVMRVLFFVSGLFFSVEYAPSAAKDVLFYNPLAHIVEMMRDGMSAEYVSTFVHLPYVTGFALVSMALGLLLERYTRRYLDQAS